MESFSCTSRLSDHLTIYSLKDLGYFSHFPAMPYLRWHSFLHPEGHGTEGNLQQRTRSMKEAYKPIERLCSEVMSLLSTLHCWEANHHTQLYRRVGTQYRWSARYHYSLTFKKKKKDDNRFWWRVSNTHHAAKLLSHFSHVWLCVTP